MGVPFRKVEMTLVGFHSFEFNMIFKFYLFIDNLFVIPHFMLMLYGKNNFS